MFLVGKNKQENPTIDMAKIQIKYDYQIVFRIFAPS